MGRTGGKGLVPPLSRTDLQNGRHDEHIGQRDEQEGDGEDNDADHKQSGLVHTRVSTGQPQDGEHITVEQADLLAAAAEGQLEDEHCQLHGQDEAQQQGPQSQAHTQPPAHEDAVTQGMADGHKPVIRHDRQQNAVSTAQEDEEEHLGSTARQGDEGAL